MFHGKQGKGGGEGRGRGEEKEGEGGPFTRPDKAIKHDD